MDRVKGCEATKKIIIFIGKGFHFKHEKVDLKVWNNTKRLCEGSKRTTDKCLNEIWT